MAFRVKYLYLSGTIVLTLITFLLYDYARLTTPRSTPQSVEDYYEPHEPIFDDHHDMLSRKQHDFSEYEDVLNELPNLPREYFDGSDQPRSANSTCARFPKYTSIEFNNYYWQTLVTSDGTAFQIFGAYLDDRDANKVVVRLLGVVNRKVPTVATYCQLWYGGRRDPVVVKSDRYRYIWIAAWGTQGVNQPYFVDCVVPNTQTPFAVSLVEAPCANATNALRVVNNKTTQKKRFAVCVKGLDYPHDDVSVRLVEWLEINRALGADKVFFYYFTIHPNITKTLKHYERQGFVELTPLTLPGGYPNLPPLRHLVLSKLITQRRQMEVIPYNDCFYKHMYEYDYVVLLDTDEIIMPRSGDWNDLIKRLERDPHKTSAFFTRNVYFLDQFLPKGVTFPGIPPYLHVFNHVYRTQNYTPPRHYAKTFHKTSEIITLHNHLPLQCVTWVCAMKEVDPKLAQLQHYRADCAMGLKRVCEELKRNTVMDTGVWRLKEKVVGGAVATLRALGYLAGG